jgi:nucleolar protein 6
MKGDSNKSKGYAFLEFPSYDRMSTCLQMYHHSVFDDGKSPARKINVELTAGGGGGKSGVRKERLKVKNERLNDRRERKVEKDREEKRLKGEKEGGKGAEQGASEEGIHPSRRTRVPAE